MLFRPILPLCGFWQLSSWRAELKLTQMTYIVAELSPVAKPIGYATF